MPDPTQNRGRGAQAPAILHDGALREAMKAAGDCGSIHMDDVIPAVIEAYELHKREPKAEPATESPVEFRNSAVIESARHWPATNTGVAFRKAFIQGAEWAREHLSSHPTPQEGVSGQEPVAWRVKNDFGFWYITADPALANTYRDIEKLHVEPLYARPAPLPSHAALVEAHGWRALVPAAVQSALVGIEHVHSRDPEHGGHNSPDEYFEAVERLVTALSSVQTSAGGGGTTEKALNAAKRFLAPIANGEADPAECRQNAYAAVVNINDALAALQAVKAAGPYAPQGDEDRIWNEAVERCAKIGRHWIAIFGDGQIEHITPTQYATDAVRDIIDHIRLLKRPTASGSSSPTPGEKQ